jgi:Rod binding domain-containing protein
MNSVLNPVANNHLQMAADSGRVQAQPPTAETVDAEQAFQEFYAGTFYRLMLKALRESQGEMAYFDGGQAERIFQSQLDEQIVQNLSEHHGRELAAPLYQQYLRTHPGLHTATHPQTADADPAQTRQQQPVAFDRQA